jgi:hypothetical protein
MTATLASPSQIWNSMPGWGIVADLTPSELIVARRIKTIQKLTVAGLALIVILLGGLFGYALLQSHAASSDLAVEQDRSQVLIAGQSKYSGVTQVQASIDGVDTNLAKLMASDVDLASEIGKIRAALPSGMTLKSLNVSISSAGAAAAGSQQSAIGSSLDTSGHHPIGSIQLTGTAGAMTDVARYVLQLQALPGLTDVLPTSNAADGASGSFSINLSLTDQLLTHRFQLGGPR